jgi:hypothetical protein
MERHEYQNKTVDMASCLLIWLQMNRSTPPKVVYFFLKSVGLLLAFSAIAKLVSATGSAPILEENDPIFMVSFRILFWLIGLLELIIALICFFCKRYEVSILLTAWIAGSFAFYRFGLWWISWRRPCICLGNLTEAIHVSPRTAGWIMDIIFAYVVIGSYATLFWLCRKKWKSSS